jgi:hypothetical protein
MDGPEVAPSDDGHRPIDIFSAEGLGLGQASFDNNHLDDAVLGGAGVGASSLALQGGDLICSWGVVAPTRGLAGAIRGGTGPTTP